MNNLNPAFLIILLTASVIGNILQCGCVSLPWYDKTETKIIKTDEARSALDEVARSLGVNPEGQRTADLKTTLEMRCENQAYEGDVFTEKQLLIIKNSLGTDIYESALSMQKYLERQKDKKVIIVNEYAE